MPQLPDTLVRAHERLRTMYDDIPKAMEGFDWAGGEAVSALPRFQLLWSAFDFLVRRKFEASTPVNRETGHADVAALRGQMSRHLLPEAELEFPPVIHETDFCHDGWDWRPFRHVLTGVPQEAKFLDAVEWFFEEFCRSDEYTVAGVEEPRTAARRFLAVNYFIG